MCTKIQQSKTCYKCNFYTGARQGNQREWEYLSAVTVRKRKWLHLIDHTQIPNTDIADLKPGLRKANINSSIQFMPSYLRCKGRGKHMNVCVCTEESASVLPNESSPSKLACYIKKQYNQKKIFILFVLGNSKCYCIPHPPVPKNSHCSFKTGRGQN